MENTSNLLLVDEQLMQMPVHQALGCLACQKASALHTRSRRAWRAERLAGALNSLSRCQHTMLDQEEAPASFQYSNLPSAEPVLQLPHSPPRPMASEVLSRCRPMLVQRCSRWLVDLPPPRSLRLRSMGETRPIVFCMLREKAGDEEVRERNRGHQISFSAGTPI